MKSMIKLGAIILPLTLLSACGNTDEINALKSQVQEAMDMAKSASSNADSATATANAAKQSADDTASKLERMFAKAMSK